MASSSSFHQQNQEFNAFSGTEPPGKRRRVCESCRLFDVFINHRGIDVKQTLATQLYNSLKEIGIRAFLDSEEKELGDSFPSTIETAIRSASVHIAIFSEKYAESAWCLAELVLMLQSKAKIIPVFYQVKPEDLRRIEKGVYADAFIKYENKGRYLKKLNEWKEALQSLSFIAGEEFNSFSDRHCQKIVAAVQKEVQRKTLLHVAEYPVGLENLVEDFERRCLDELVQDFENQCGLKNGNDKAKVVGIFGMGGSGKTTLAKELFNSRITLEQLLRDLFDRQHLSFTSREEGKSYLKDSLQRSPTHLRFLIVLDDIDHVDQLNDLLVREILNKSPTSVVIVTTRDAGVLISADITNGYQLKGMDITNGRELFCWHAFDQSSPSSGYEELVDSFVDVCGGLPLSLQVLGRHLRRRSEDYWRSQLIKARKMLHRDIKQRLRISFDALDGEEKQVFMDIACFFVGHMKSEVERILEVSGWNAHNVLQTLKDKCLVEETKFNTLEGQIVLRVQDQIVLRMHDHKFNTLEGQIGLRMHDHLRDLGREMALELSPPRRLCHPEDLKSLDLMGFKNILTKTNGRCFYSIFDKSMGCQVTFFLGQSDIFVETSASLLWLELRGKYTEQPSIPSWIPLQNLQVLRIHGIQFKTLWENHIQVPSQLKELELQNTSLNEIPDFLAISDSLENGRKSSSVKAPMSGLKKLHISHEIFVPKILISGIHFPSLESITLIGMENLMEVNLTRVKTLNSLSITNCKNVERLTGTYLRNLVLLNIRRCPELEFVELSLGHLNCLERITIVDCEQLKSVSGIADAAKLVHLEISNCEKLEFEHLCLSGMKCLERITIVDCKQLKSVSGISDLAKLVHLEISNCGKAELQYLCLSGMKCLERIRIAGCKQLKSLSGISDLAKVVRLEISNCGKFEYLCFSGMKCLERIRIAGCKQLESVSGISDLAKLVHLEISNCGKLELEYLCLSGVKSLERITIAGWKQLKSVSGISDLENLVHLEISNCGKLEFECLCLSSMKCLESIIFDTNVKVKYLELDGCQNLKIIKFGYENLAKLSIQGCPEVQLPVFRALSCLERIIIDGCGKFQYLQLNGCQNLRSVSGNFEHTRMTINQCPELEDLPSLSRLSCLKHIEIDSCEKLQNIMLPITLNKLSVRSCRDLQRVAGTVDLTNLTRLYLNDCPELEELEILSRLTCLEHIEIDSCEKLQNIMLPTTLISLSVQSCKDLQRVAGTGDLIKFKKLKIRMCPKLEELPILSRLCCLEHIEIDSCEKLQNIMLLTTLISLSLRSCRDLQSVSGTGDHTKLTELYIIECPELEELPILSRLNCFEHIEIDSFEKLQNIVLPTTLISLSVQRCRDLQRVAGTGDLTKLKKLKIRMCPELEELPFLSCPSCLEQIEIDSCEKLQNIMLPTTLISLSVRSCRDLQRVSGTGDLTKLAKLYINECPELVQLQILSRGRCLKQIVIESCEKLENIAGIEELQALQTILILYCCNAAIQSCILNLKSVLSDFTAMIGRAADGAQSTLKKYLFADADAVTETSGFFCRSFQFEWSKLSAVIGCYVVVVDSSKSVEDINKSLSDVFHFNGFRLKVREGEWIIVMVAIRDFDYIKSVEDTFRRYGIMKKGYRAEVKKGEGWKTMYVLRILLLLNRLFLQGGDSFGR